LLGTIRDSTAVTEMGRKSLGCVGPVFLGTGQILASFHCVGTIDLLMDILTRSASILQNAGAPRRRNHAGKPSGPVAVGLRVSTPDATVSMATQERKSIEHSHYSM